MIRLLAVPHRTHILTPFLLTALGFMGTAAQATTYKVTTLAESGPGSISEAISNINQGNGTSPYLINFAPNVRGSIKLEDGVLGVGDTVIINGPGPDKLSIDGQNKDGVFAFGGQITLKNLTLINGNINGNISNAVEKGGAIQNNGFLTIENCQIKNSFAAKGGGIYNRGTVIVRDSEIIGCKGNDGAGLYNEGQKSRALVRNSLFQDNGTRSDTAKGGAIYNEGQLEIADASIVSNDAGIGAGIYNAPSPSEDQAGGDMYVVASVFGANSVAQYGGGVYNGEGALASVYDSDFIQNEANLESELRGGGGIDNAGQMFADFVNLRYNRAGSGGAVYNSGQLFYSRGDVNNNTANVNSSQGGGIYSQDGGINADHINFYNNVAREKDSDFPQGSGGALFGQGFELADCYISSNEASEAGGAIYGDTFDMRRCQIVFNHTTLNNSTGGGIFNALADFALFNSNINQCNIQYNTSFFGGGIVNRGNLNLTNSNIIGNEGIQAGGGIFNIDLSNNDDFSSPASLSVSRCAFVSNTSNVASALYNDSQVAEGDSPQFKGVARISNTTFNGNDATFGGTISNTSTLVLHNCTLADNVSESFVGPSGIDNTLFDGEGTGKISIGNTIVQSDGENDNFAGFSGDLAVSEGYNISSDATGPNTSTDRQNTDAKLGGLAYNGGSTLNQTLLAGSPAINTGNPAFQGEGQNDQRGQGFPRVKGGRLDIGAIEVQNDAPSFLSITGPSGVTAKFENGIVSNPLRGQSNQGEFVTFTTLVTDPDGPRDITNVEFILGEKTSELRLTYNAETNKFSVRDAAGTSTSATAGTNTTLTVETGALDVGGSKASRANGGLQVRWRLKITSFKDVTQKLRLQGRDAFGGRSAAPTLGTWTFVKPNSQGVQASAGSA